MNVDEILKLIQAVSEYDLTSFKLEEGGMKISLKREKEMVQGTVAVSQQEIPVAVPAAAAVSAAPAAASEVSENAGGNLMTSPLVGTFYSASSPDAEPFVKVGDTVKKGQVLGIIEAMKLMNEIESEYDGVVKEILVKNEEVVEYGQPLFRIG